jgi:excisionase family DNA binding protein
MPSQYLLLTECAAEARVSVSTVRHWILTRRLASTRPGRRRLVRRVDFDEFLESTEASSSVAGDIDRGFATVVNSPNQGKNADGPIDVPAAAITAPTCK